MHVRSLIERQSLVVTGARQSTVYDQTILAALVEPRVAGVTLGGRSRAVRQSIRSLLGRPQHQPRTYPDHAGLDRPGDYGAFTRPKTQTSVPVTN